MNKNEVRSSVNAQPIIDEVTPLARMIQQWRSSPALKPIDPNDQPQTVEKLRAAGVLREAELYMEFVARTGLGTQQIEHMSLEEIRDFVQRGEDRGKNEVSVESFASPRFPKKFFLTVD